MPSDERVSIGERPTYLGLVAPRYAVDNRSGPSGLLTEMAAVTGLHRKSLIPLMGMPSVESAPKRPEYRRRKYGSALEDVVRVIREKLDYVCASRLVDNKYWAKEHSTIFQAG